MIELESVLEAYRQGSIELDAAVERVRSAFFERQPQLTMDHDRPRRTGAAEVIYAEGKTPDQIVTAASRIRGLGHNVLITRIDESSAEVVREECPEATHFPIARLLSIIRKPVKYRSRRISVVSAGTSDQPVAEEAALTAEFYGNPVLRIHDVGVAGIHRLLDRIEEIRTTHVAIVVAGMEGALPSAVGGLIDRPVIAVPTSVGYGAAFGGIAALLGMLNSCAAGVSVVNIDNGFGAGYLASRINAQ